MRYWSGKFIVGAALFAFSLSPSVNAQEFNWTNATGDNSWNTEANWNLGGDGIPLGGDININGGVGLCILTSDSFITPTTLDLGPGAALDMQSGEFVFGPNGAQNPYSIQNSGEINVLQDSILGLRENNRNFSPATINVIDGGILKVHSAGAAINTSTQNTGNGTINMSSFNGPSSKITGASGASLSFQKQTIQGFGDIGENNLGLTLDPDSIIDSNFDGQEMTIDVLNASGIINQGIMKASNGGALRFTGTTTIDNTGGLIEAMTGSEVLFGSGFNIAGGILQQNGTGTFEMFGSGSLANLTLGGVYIEVPNAGSLILDGTINNQGEITTNATQTTSNIFVPTTATLTGGGTITLGGIFPLSRIRDSGANGNATLTNQDNTIQGFGDIGHGTLQLINQAGGVVDANDNSGSLTLDTRTGASMINQGLYTASDGGNLVLTSGSFDNTDGIIQPQDGSTIQINSTATISGGTLSDLGTGSYIAIGGTISDIAIEGDFNIDNTRSINLSGTIENQGEITLNSTTTTSNLYVPTAATLTGGGTITLGGIHPLCRIRDSGANGDATLTNQDNTIQGYGGVGHNTLRLINQVDGVVKGSDPAGSLILDPPAFGPMVNQGLYTASGGGDLLLSTGEFDNTTGMIMPESMSTITITNEADLTGGLLVADNESSIRFGGSATLTDVTLQSIGSGTFESISGAPTLIDATNEAPISVRNAASLSFSGTINNQGEITTNATQTTSNIFVPTTATLTGGGTITLGGSFPLSRIRDSGANGNATLTNQDNTIQGFGDIGHGTLQLINQAGGVVDANDNSGSLTLDTRTGTSMINQGLYTASDGGNLVLRGGDFDNTDGVIQPQDGSTIQINSDATISGGTLSNLGTGSYIAIGGTITDLTIEGEFNIDNSRVINLAGTIENQGEITLNSTTTTSNLYVPTAATLTGGGTITLGGTLPLCRIRDSGANGNATLTNQDNTLQGFGEIGFGTLNLINQVDGTVHANVDGQTLTIDPRGSEPLFANEGTVIASTGGTLRVEGTLENGVNGTMTGDSIINSTETILNLGTIAPGNSAGTLTINANLIMNSSSSLEIEIENLNMLDLLDVNGAVVLDGELNLSFLNGYVPSPNDTFDILTADSLTGEFSNAPEGTLVESPNGSGLFAVNYVGNTVRLSNIVSYTMGQSLAVTRGTQVNGSTSELALSDNSDLSIRRSNTDVVSRTEFEVEGTSPTGNPTSMSVVLEGSVFARTNVAQRIELFNYDTNSWEIVDSRLATRFVDSKATVVISGDLSRFVEAGTFAVKARVRFTSGNPRQRFTSHTDQFVWIIE